MTPCDSDLSIGSHGRISPTDCNMTKNPVLIGMLGRKAGCDVTSPMGAEFLRNDIESITGEHVGLNTIKRIVGILDYEGAHRPVIMNIIAKYLGYDSWSMLESVLKDKISGFSDDSSIVEIASLADGQLIELEWNPDRKVVLRHDHGKSLTVMSSRNSKLLAGDILTLSQIAPGFPLYASEVVRDNISLGNYTAAAEEGIKSITLL